MMNKENFTEFLLIGNVNMANKKMINFMNFIFDNKRIEYNEILDTPFFNSNKVDNYFIQLFPLSSIPKNYETLETYFKRNGAFQFQSFVYEDETEYNYFLETISKIMDDEVFYSISRNQDDIVPKIKKITFDEIKEYNLMKNEEEYMAIWKEKFEKLWVTKKKVKKQIEFTKDVSHMF